MDMKNGFAKKYSVYQNINEKEFVNNALLRIEKYFIVAEREFTGKHLAGNKLKIDLIISPKDKTKWKNKDVHFGVEFKSPYKLNSVNTQTKFMRQCVDYSYTEFGDYGFIPILSYPRFEIDEHYCDEKSIKLLRHFLNAFNVGEMWIDKNYHGLVIMFANSDKIWSEKNGVSRGNLQNFSKKFGSK
jgi:hypothetical protein